MQNIIVSSNCQTAGIALALKVMLPNAQVSGIPTPSLNNKEALRNLRQELETADVWITSAKASDYIPEEVTPLVIRIPKIIFRSFHPDLTYVRSKKDNGVIKGAGNSDYHSKIIFWCASKGKNKKFTKNAFNNSIYEKLQYYSYWDREIASLRNSFLESDIDFDSFIRKMLLPEPFMHSVNHPTSPALCHVARQIARKLGAPDVLLNAPIERSIPDTLASGDIWPVYPEVAERFGFSGSYIWKIGNSRICHSVEDYIDLSYNQYKDLDFENLHPQGIEESLFTRAIG